MTAALPSVYLPGLADANGRAAASGKLKALAMLNMDLYGPSAERTAIHRAGRNLVDCSVSHPTQERSWIWLSRYLQAAITRYSGGLLFPELSAIVVAYTAPPNLRFCWKPIFATGGGSRFVTTSKYGGEPYLRPESTADAALAAVAAAVASPASAAFSTSRGSQPPAAHTPYPNPIRLLPGSNWPLCRGCSRPLHFVMQLRLNSFNASTSAAGDDDAECMLLTQTAVPAAMAIGMKSYPPPPLPAAATATATATAAPVPIDFSSSAAQRARIAAFIAGGYYSRVAWESNTPEADVMIPASTGNSIPHTAAPTATTASPPDEMLQLFYCIGCEQDTADMSSPSALVRFVDILPAHDAAEAAALRTNPPIFIPPKVDPNPSTAKAMTSASATGVAPAPVRAAVGHASPPVLLPELQIVGWSRVPDFSSYEEAHDCFGIDFGSHRPTLNMWEPASEMGGAVNGSYIDKLGGFEHGLHGDPELKPCPRPGCGRYMELFYHFAAAGYDLDPSSVASELPWRNGIATGTIVMCPYHKRDALYLSWRGT